MTSTMGSSVLEDAILQAEEQSSTVGNQHNKPTQITEKTWKICTTLCRAYCELALTQPPQSALSLNLSRILVGFAGCAGSKCLTTGDLECFTLGSVALSLALPGLGDWRDLAGTAAVLRAAVNEHKIDREAVLSALPPIRIEVRKLLESMLPLGDFGIRIDGTGNNAQFVTIVAGRTIGSFTRY